MKSLWAFVVSTGVLCGCVEDVASPALAGDPDDHLGSWCDQGGGDRTNPRAILIWERFQGGFTTTIVSASRTAEGQNEIAGYDLKSLGPLAFSAVIQDQPTELRIEAQSASQLRGFAARDVTLTVKDEDGTRVAFPFFDDAGLDACLRQ